MLKRTCLQGAPALYHPGVFSMEEPSDRPGAGTASCSLERHRTCTRVRQDARASFLCVQRGALLLLALAAPGASAFLPCLRSWAPAARQHHGTPTRLWVSASASASGTGPVGGFAEHDFIALQVISDASCPSWRARQTPHLTFLRPAAYRGQHRPACRGQDALGKHQP